MDELLFALCSPQDRVLTTRRMNDSHVEYLNAIGFQFERNRFDLVPALRARGRSNPYESLEERDIDGQLTDFLSVADELEPFAVVSGIAGVAQRYGLCSTFPAEDAVQRINTKSYCLEVREVVGIGNVGLLVDSVEALLREGTALLVSGPFLIKDDYGVSGKGNQIITQQGSLERIAQYLSGQVQQGKHVRFVLEPYLAKKLDFSCQFQVGKDGSFHLISVQHLVNDGLAFGMSTSPGADLLAKLESEEYFRQMEEIGKKLYADGYFGHVCVDSMWLQDGSLIPLVEINARRSMSLIKHAMDQHLAREGKTGSLTSIAAAHDGSIGFTDLLHALRQSGLLFEAGQGAGIIPLTSGTLFPESSQGKVRGRLYVEVVYEAVEQRSALLADLTTAMQQSGFQVRV